MANKLVLFLPVKPSFITQAFGTPNPIYTAMGLQGHNGLDLQADTGQIVRAAHDGVVAFSGEQGTAGSGVVLRTNDKRELLDGTSCYVKSIYWHLLPNIPVKAGQQIKCGDIIGYADSTGNATGPHLHFGIKPLTDPNEYWIFDNLEQKNGYNGAIDPAPYLSTMYAEDYALQLKKVGILKQLIALYQKLLASIKR